MIHGRGGWGSDGGGQLSAFASIHGLVVVEQWLVVA